MARSISNLIAVRDEMITARRRHAYAVASGHHHDAIGKLAALHGAIEAIDQVISEGIDDDTPPPSITVL